MIQTIIFTHGQLSKGLVSAVGVIAGTMENTTTLSLTLEDNPDDLSQQLNRLVSDADDDTQILIVNDIFGGTPSNLSLVCAHRHPNRKIRVIAGANLAMLLELVNQLETTTDIDELATQCIEAAKTGVINSSLKVRNS